MHAIILAAGLGTRFRPYTDKLAKPAIPFLNLPMIAYVLYYLKQLGLKRLVINTHHLPESIHEVIDQLGPHDFEIIYSHEEPKVLGSGGGVGFAKEYLIRQDDFVYANGDEIFFFKHNKGLSPLVEAHRKSKPLATLLTCDHPELGSRFGAIWTDKNGLVKDIGKTTQLSGLTPQHFTGVQILSQNVFSYIPDGFSNIFIDTLLPAIQKGETVKTVYEPEMIWYEIGDKQSYLKATEDVLQSGSSILKDILSYYPSQLSTSLKI